MKEKFVLMALCFGLGGCAEFQQRANIYNSTITEYFANPQGKVMITVASVHATEWAQIQCHRTSGLLKKSGAKNESFKTYAPYVTVTNLSKQIDGMRALYNGASKNDKKFLEMSMAADPLIFIYVCQNQGRGGVVGKIYFNGKEVASDVANIDYGVVNLNYTLSLNDVILEQK
ncbi:MAG: hypothetical protein AAB893_03885 [Patescibacteria group bacterium]